MELEPHNFEMIEPKVESEPHFYLLALLPFLHRIYILNILFQKIRFDKNFKKVNK